MWHYGNLFRRLLVCENRCCRERKTLSFQGDLHYYLSVCRGNFARQGWDNISSKAIYSEDFYSARIRRCIGLKAIITTAYSCAKEMLINKDGHYLFQGHLWQRQLVCRKLILHICLGCNLWMLMFGEIDIANIFYGHVLFRTNCYRFLLGRLLLYMFRTINLNTFTSSCTFFTIVPLSCAGYLFLQIELIVFQLIVTNRLRIDVTIHHVNILTRKCMKDCFTIQQLKINI